MTGKSSALQNNEILDLCVCVRSRAHKRVCVCVSERERERERVLCMWPAFKLCINMHTKLVVAYM